MTCVSSPSFSVLVNGQPKGRILPTRDLRQGDPLSLYLFLICAEGLSAMLSRSESEGRIFGMPVSFRGTRISHLFFADDSLLFCRANLIEWQNVLEILKRYERALGQKLNTDKTSIFFQQKYQREFKDHIGSLAGISATTNYHKYLGLPAMVGRSKSRTFAGIKDRVCKRLDGWKERFLLQAGKEVLIKAVVQAISTFSMSVFRLPKSLCANLNSLMSRFWWSSQKKEKRMVWLSWEKLGESKHGGGMGFRELDSFNLALLAKQGWRILQNPDSLVAKILKEKYFPDVPFLEACVGSRPSYVWRSIAQSRHLLEAGLFWRVGNGLQISILKDKWLPDCCTVLVQSPMFVLHLEAKVSELIDPTTRKWNEHLISSIFSPSEVERICSIPLSPLMPRDRLVWAGSKQGLFTVRSAYFMEKQRRDQEKGESSNKGDERKF
jgi:hypothetical protein